MGEKCACRDSVVFLLNNVRVAPQGNLKLIHCSCSSDQLCSSPRCGCTLLILICVMQMWSILYLFKKYDKENPDNVAEEEIDDNDDEDDCDVIMDDLVH